jgi:hypothetical protein
VNAKKGREGKGREGEEKRREEKRRKKRKGAKAQGRKEEGKEVPLCVLCASVFQSLRVSISSAVSLSPP